MPGVVVVVDAAGVVVNVDPQRVGARVVHGCRHELVALGIVHCENYDFVGSVDDETEVVRLAVRAPRLIVPSVAGARVPLGTGGVLPPSPARAGPVSYTHLTLPT